MTFTSPSSTTVESRHAFATTRLAQIARLVQLQKECPEEFSGKGLKLVRHAIFVMVLDCRQAGLATAFIRAALAAGAAPDGPSSSYSLRSYTAAGNGNLCSERVQTS